MAYNYWCNNSTCYEKCDFCDKAGNLKIEDKDNHACPQTEEIKLKLMGEEVFGLIGPRMDKTAIGKEKLARSRAHFKKEILPTMTKKEQIPYIGKDIMRKK